MYRNVQYAGDENLRRVQRWSIETGQLPQTCVVIDQNQTPRAASEGGPGQIVKQTLQSQILLWEGRLQGGILTDDITRSDQNRRTRGQTEEQQQHSS